MTERPLRRGNWSVQELVRLRQLLPRRGVEATAFLLRRSARSVMRKALDLLRVPQRRGSWTASDDQRLQESWGAVEVRLLAAMLGRPPQVVRARAAELQKRLHAGAWSHDEVQALKVLFGTRRDQDLEVCLRRPEAEIVAMAAKLCLAKDKRFVAGLAAAPLAGRRSMPRWVEPDITRLRQLYPDRDNLEVARLLGRTVASVANKANQLGLRKSHALLATIGRCNIAIRYGRVGESAANPG